MAQKYELFDENKTYIDAMGRVKNAADIRRDHDGLFKVSQENDPCVVELDASGHRFDSIALLSQFKARAIEFAGTLFGMTEEDIDFGETVEDALAKLEEIRNKPQPKGVSPEERIAF